ncbi:hypothetical protein EDD18DRAFT_1353830 [Armillaria luteobubalina]|uniref:Uncharacterized protein n=1 Tax=Armillaria luteobubalina TaxID=153913 RepID=A0AA39TNT6_9AGAR|nr:hypothetical protein EDD18DRAFT_1353830 [Armillaria luteobubalina]
MATQTDIPPYLTNDDKVFIFQFLDARLNSGILNAVLFGIYTSIFAITLWNMFVNKRWPIRRAMVVIIIFLYCMITISFATDWQLVHSAFIDNGQTFWEVYTRLSITAQAAYLEGGITSSMSTIVADLLIIWWCWMVWGRRWLAVLLPTLLLIAAIVLRIIQVYREYFNTTLKIFSLLYVCFILATTLWCTLLIIYRILIVAGVRRRANGRLKVFQHFLEVLVESSTFYSISLIVYLALFIHGDFGSFYFDVIAGIVKGIAPTLLVGRTTAGRRARPDDSQQGSVIASASIRSREQEHSRTSSQDDRPARLVIDPDLEAQLKSAVRGLQFPAFFPEPSARSQGVLPNFENIPLDHLGDIEGSNRVSVESLRLGS